MEPELTAPGSHQNLSSTLSLPWGSLQIAQNAEPGPQGPQPFCSPGPVQTLPMLAAALDLMETP